MLEPIGYDDQGAPLYEHQLEPLITARDCELAGYDLRAVMEAAKAATP